MLNLDLAELSHLVQDSSLSLETRLALILVNHGFTPSELTKLNEIPPCPWIAFEKPFIKIFKKYRPLAPFMEITSTELITSITPYIK